MQDKLTHTLPGGAPDEETQEIMTRLSDLQIALVIPVPVADKG